MNNPYRSAPGNAAAEAATALILVVILAMAASLLIGDDTPNAPTGLGASVGGTTQREG
jgi:hypothetical protein